MEKEKTKTAIEKKKKPHGIRRMGENEIRPGTRPDSSWKGNQNMKPGDNARYIRHALELAGQGEIDIADPEAVKNRMIWYLEQCAKDDCKPTVAGICLAMGIDRRTFYAWREGETRNGTHSPIAKKAYQAMQSLLEQQMAEGKIDRVVGIFLSKNHFGYKDEQEITVKPGQPLGELQREEEVKDRYIDSVVFEVIEDK